MHTIKNKFPVSPSRFTVLVQSLSCPQLHDYFFYVTEIQSYLVIQVAHFFCT